MTRRLFLTTFLIAVLIGTSGLLSRVQRVEASGTIYIRADGSIDPSTAPIQRNGNVYTLTGNITSDAGGIVIERNNTIVDGAGYTLQGPGSEIGITLSARRNVTIRNTEITTFYYGIELDSSSNSTISGNNITANNEYGIRFYSSSNVSISGNNITDNYECISFSGSSDNSITGNSIAANYEDAVGLYNSSNNKIFGNNIAGGGNGIDLYLSNGNNLTGNTVSNMSRGIFLEYSGHNSLSGNVITNNHYGVILKISTGNVLRSNNMTDNEYNVGIYGIDDDLFKFGSVSLSSFLQDIDSSNTVNGKPVCYWVNQHGNQIPANAGFVAVINCTEITVSNMELTKNVQGILLAYTTNSLLQNLTTTDNYVGIHLVCSDNNTVTANNVTKNNCGISLYYSSYNIFTQNIVTENDQFGVGIGIGLLFDFGSIYPPTTIPSEGNLFRGNMISHNANSWGGGLWLTNPGTKYTIIVGNNITGNSNGVHLRESSNNSIYHNNFVDNYPQVYVETSGYANFWDNGVEGNYWNNYTGVDVKSGFYQNETGSDGIGDIPYVIDANNLDNYPLSSMFSCFNTLYNYQANIVSNSSISGFNFNIVNPSQATLSFNVTGDTGTQGFCRICIPKALINSSYVVKLNGEVIAEPQVRQLPCSNETIEYLYINYTHSEHTIEISGTTTIPEFSSFLILSLFMVATLLAVLMYRRKRLVYRNRRDFA